MTQGLAKTQPRPTDWARLAFKQFACAPPYGVRVISVILPTVTLRWLST